MKVWRYALTLVSLLWGTVSFAQGTSGFSSITSVWEALSHVSSYWSQTTDYVYEKTIGTFAAIPKTPAQIADYTTCWSILYVGAGVGANAEQTGKDWGHAFGIDHINSAIAEAVSQNADCLFVQKGNFAITETIQIPSNIKLFGGFAGNESSVDGRKLPNGKPSKYTGNLTTLDGQNKLCHIISVHGKATDVSLDGFEIKGGYCEPHQMASNFVNTLGSWKTVLAEWAPDGADIAFSMLGNYAKGAATGAGIRELGGAFSNTATWAKGKWTTRSLEKEVDAAKAVVAKAQRDYELVEKNGQEIDLKFRKELAALEQTQSIKTLLVDIDAQSRIIKENAEHVHLTGWEVIARNMEEPNAAVIEHVKALTEQLALEEKIVSQLAQINSGTPGWNDAVQKVLASEGFLYEAAQNQIAALARLTAAKQAQVGLFSFLTGKALFIPIAMIELSKGAIRNLDYAAQFAWVKENTYVEDGAIMLKGAHQKLDDFLEASVQMTGNSEVAKGIRSYLAEPLSEDKRKSSIEIASLLYQQYTKGERPPKELVQEFFNHADYYFGALGFSSLVWYANGAFGGALKAAGAKAAGILAAKPIGVLLTALMGFDTVSELYNQSWGGGLFVYSSSDMWIRNSYFHHNKAGYGGAIYLGLGGYNTVQIDNSVFENNEAISIPLDWVKWMPVVNSLPLNWAYGGAIYKNKGNLVLNGTQFHNNSLEKKSNGGGGALYAGVGSTLVKDSEFVGNSAYTGGAIAVADWDFSLTGTQMHVKNSSFYENISDYGSALYSSQIPDIQVEDSKFFSTASVGSQIQMSSGLHMTRSTVNGTPGRSLVLDSSVSKYFEVSHSCLDGGYEGMIDPSEPGNKSVMKSLFQKSGDNAYTQTGTCDASELTSAEHAHSTYLMCYGIHDDKLIKHWAMDGNAYLLLVGKWDRNITVQINANYFTVASHSKAELESKCRKSLNFSEGEGPIRMFASNSDYLGYEYPLVYPKMSIKTDGPGALDYEKILEYAILSKYAYSGRGELTPIPQHYIEMDSKVYKSTDGSTSLVTAYAFKTKKEIVIAYKGTEFNTHKGKDEYAVPENDKDEESSKDIAIDMHILLQNTFGTSEYLQKALEDAMVFYKKVKSELNKDGSNTIVLTGDSMGAYLAADVAAKTGELARVFSSPGTRMDSSWDSMLKNAMRLTNVINFVQEHDSISSRTGRHIENVVIFPANSKCTLGHFWISTCHSLADFIKDTLSKKHKPNFMYVTPDTLTGHGLKHSINKYGAIDYSSTHEHQD